MRRTFAVDVLACPRCDGRLRLVTLIDTASVIQRILQHLGLPSEIPEPRPARSPPLPLDARTVRVVADSDPGQDDDAIVVSGGSNLEDEERPATDDVVPVLAASPLRSSANRGGVSGLVTVVQSEAF